MSKETGGPAFPRVERTYIGDGNFDEYHYEGMTLRDYFAIKALQGELSSEHPEVGIFCDSDGKTRYEKGADAAYKWADAMLKERNK